MNFDSAWPLWLICGAFVIYRLIYIGFVVRAKKERTVFKLKRMAVSVLSYAGSVAVLKDTLPVLEVAIISGLVGAGAAFLIVRQPDRSRYIPAEVKRAVIARDLKGAKFDSAIHHLDHIVAYSNGGDHSLHNLRVLKKERNLAKGAKAPRVRDFLRRGA
jgi:hypothetical protein